MKKNIANLKFQSQNWPFDRRISVLDWHRVARQTCAVFKKKSPSGPFLSLNVCNQQYIHFSPICNYLFSPTPCKTIHVDKAAFYSLMTGVEDVACRPNVNLRSIDHSWCENVQRNPKLKVHILRGKKKPKKNKKTLTQTANPLWSSLQGVAAKADHKCICADTVKQMLQKAWKYLCACTDRNTDKHTQARKWFGSPCTVAGKSAQCANAELRCAIKRQYFLSVSQTASDHQTHMSAHVRMLAQIHSQHTSAHNSQSSTCRSL